MTGFEERLAKVRQIMALRGLSAVLLRRNPNLAWLIAGRSHVPNTLDLACFDLIITEDTVRAVTNAIEAPRLIAEEFPAEISVEVVNWWEARDQLLPIGATVGSDQFSGVGIDIGLEIEMARQCLVAEDRARFKVICQDATRALGKAMRRVKSQDREIDVAGIITQSLWAENLELVFLGVAGSSRAKLFRHPLPTTALVGDRVLASICARRKGLIASVTRAISFGSLAGAVATDVGREYENLLKVEAAMLDATQIGSSFAKPIEAAVAAYRTHGFDSDEWQRHHQGGPTGYLPRDWIANLASTRVIAADQPIAWNPTAAGWKVEDTWITGSDGLKNLTEDSTWPSVTLAGRLRPAVLQL